MDDSTTALSIGSIFMLNSNGSFRVSIGSLEARYVAAHKAAIAKLTKVIAFFAIVTSFAGKRQNPGIFLRGDWGYRQTRLANDCHL